MGLVADLQRDALDQSVPVSKLLVMCRVICSKLHIGNIPNWIEKELHSYSSEDKLPDYRVVKGVVQHFHPNLGWRNTGDGEIEMSLRQPAALFEKMANSDAKAGFSAPNGFMDISFGEYGSMSLETRVPIGQLTCWGIVNRVRGLILEWAIELDQAGVTAEGFDFDKSQIEGAQNVTDNFIANNQSIGAVGSVSEGSSASSSLNASYQIDKVALLIGKVKDSIPGLPAGIQEDMGAAVSEAERVLQNGGAPSAVEKSVALIKDIALRASGSLTADAILAAIKALS